MANYPQELVQDAVSQSHTGHMTELWFLPTRPLRLNTNDDILLKQHHVASVFSVLTSATSQLSKRDQHQINF